MSQFGEPNYTNGGAGQDLANSHSPSHIYGSALSCVNCHANTTVDGISIKSGSTVHTDGTIDVNISSSYELGRLLTTEPGQKNCSATYCHPRNGGSGAANRQVG